jgi:hypothetical protein
LELAHERSCFLSSAVENGLCRVNEVLDEPEDLIAQRPDVLGNGEAGGGRDDPPFVGFSQSSPKAPARA